MSFLNNLLSAVGLIIKEYSGIDDFSEETMSNILETLEEYYSELVALYEEDIPEEAGRYVEEALNQYELLEQAYDEGDVEKFYNFLNKLYSVVETLYNKLEG